MTIFVVDDSLLIRTRLRQRIRQMAGATLLGEAGTAKEAIDGIMLSQPDVVIVDLELKDSSGLEVIRALPEMPKPCMCIVFASNLDATLRTACLAAGAQFAFDKTQDVGEFLNTLSRVVAA